MAKNPTRRPRLPRRVFLGKGYYVDVLLATQAELWEVINDEPDSNRDILYGLWDADHAWPKFGTIYIWKKPIATQKWDTYWHELLHAVNDLMAWDRDHPLVT